MKSNVVVPHLSEAETVVMRTKCAPNTTIAQLVQEHKKVRGRKWRGKVGGVQSEMRVVSPWIVLYLGMEPLYPSAKFRNEFRVPREFFEMVHQDLMKKAFVAWKTLRDAVQSKGIRSEVKVLKCLWLMGSGPRLLHMDDESKIGP